jgi:hypothetical protein
MSWETRHGRRHYYAARRVDGKVEKTYFGSGDVAEIAARQDADARAAREAFSAAIVQERARLFPADQALAALEEACERTFSAAMVAAGYHRSNYCRWRRRRGRA